MRLNLYNSTKVKGANNGYVILDKFTDGGQAMQVRTKNDWATLSHIHARAALLAAIYVSEA